MNKKNLISAICGKLEEDLRALKEAALATYDAATNEESKPENEYDTRALEASYLAGAQAQRVVEIEELLYTYKTLPIRSFSPADGVASTALVELESKGKRSFVFIMSKGGGLKIKVDGTSVQTLTPGSPLGEALLGLHQGDTAVIEYKDDTQDFKIIQIL
jgi:transcription elongation GreA/GreB family factor